MPEIPKLSGREMLILSVLTQGEKYGLEIVDAVKKSSQGKESISLGTLYTTLHRIEKKGFVESRWGEATEERGGARRRYYRPTALGARALNQSQRVYMGLWQINPRAMYGSA